MAKIDLWGLQGEWFFEVGPELERWAIQAGYYKDDGSFPSMQNAVKYSDRPEKKAQIDAYTGAGMLGLGEIGGALLEGLPALANTKVGKAITKLFGKNADDVVKATDDVANGGDDVVETVSSRNKPKAEGVPNSSEIQAKDANGKTTKYTTYDSNGKMTKEYRGTGKSHGNIPRPNVKEPKTNTNPNTGKTYQNGFKVRPARPDEIPK